MIETVIKNERYMSARYVREKGIHNGVVVVGTHKAAEYLAMFSGRPVPSVDAIGENKLPGLPSPGHRNLWLVCEADNYDPSEIRKAIDYCRREHARLLCIVLLSNIKPDSVIEKYSEMELMTAMDDSLGELRLILGEYDNACLLFFDRIFGAEFDSLGLSQIKREAEENGTVTVTQDMANRYISALYISDAVDAALTVSKYGKPGNAYNASSFYLSEFQLRSEVYTLLARHGIKLRISGETSEPVYSALSNGKLRSLGYENVCSFSDALRYTLLHHLERFSIQTDRIRDGYSGKLDTLRTLEKDMLREIDRICRAHDIRYFISYGTMLGAVRHGGFIPWDDDVDVAMLRSEFEKFRQIAPKELNERFSYESHTNKNGYHYFFDRITARDTYFASKYSDGYDMHKGISVDIFVVDSVPANPKSAYRFWKGLMRRRKLMNVRWKNTARKDKAYLLSKLLLPILRLRSMDSYSRSYEKAVRKYEHKNTGWVMPASSDHVYRGTFPIETFAEVVPYRFDDVDTFIPVGYEDFLKAWYGSNYMDMLPLCEQNPFHDYYRLDLGSNIRPDSGIHFDYTGELK